MGLSLPGTRYQAENGIQNPSILPFSNRLHTFTNPLHTFTNPSILLQTPSILLQISSKLLQTPSILWDICLTDIIRKWHTNPLKTFTNSLHTFTNPLHLSSNRLHTFTNPLHTFPNRLHIFTNSLHTLRHLLDCFRYNPKMAYKPLYDEVWDLTYSWVPLTFFEQIFPKTVGFYIKSKRFWKLGSPAFQPCMTPGGYFRRVLRNLKKCLKKSVFFEKIWCEE